MKNNQFIWAAIALLGLGAIGDKVGAFPSLSHSQTSALQTSTLQAQTKLSTSQKDSEDDDDDKEDEDEDEDDDHGQK